jgi:hypothetical protein
MTETTEQTGPLMYHGGQPYSMQSAAAALAAPMLIGPERAG